MWILSIVVAVGVTRNASKHDSLRDCVGEAYRLVEHTKDAPMLYYGCRFEKTPD